MGQSSMWKENLSSTMKSMVLPCKCKDQQEQKSYIIEQETVKGIILKLYLTSIKAKQIFSVLLKVHFKIYILEKNV